MVSCSFYNHSVHYLEFSMSQHKQASHVISYYGILCHNMLCVTAVIMASLIAICNYLVVQHCIIYVKMFLIGCS